MSSLAGKNVLVTGASGFIASALCRRLNVLGANVVGIVRDIDAAVQVYSVNRLVIGDVCDYDLVRRALSDNEVDVVFHLAASAIVRVSAKDPVTAYQTNVMGTVNVLEACRSLGGKQTVIVASSDKAYGDHERLPYLETHSLEPRNTYDTSKACADMIARSYASNYDMDVCVTRCSNVYGPGDMNLSRIIPNTIRRLLRGEAPMLYSDIENMEREFVYIDDVVDAYIALAEVESSIFRCGEAFNIGGTGPVRIGMLVDLVCTRSFKSNLKPVIVPRELSFREIEKQYIDASKLTAFTGWKPKTSLADGLDRTIDFYRGLLCG